MKQLQAGQVSSVSPSKALPLNINIPHQSSPNKFLPSSYCDDEDVFSVHNKVDSSNFLSSLGNERSRKDSEESSSSQESSFLRMLKQMSDKPSEKTVVGEVNMSQTMMDVSMFHHGSVNTSDSDTDTADTSLKLDPGNFLAGLASTNKDILMDDDASPMEMTRAGGNMEMTRVGGNMDMTRVGGDMDMTRVGGNMDMTRVGGNMDMTRVGGNMDITRVRGNMDMTRVGGNMDMTRVGGNMDMTRGVENENDVNTEMASAVGNMEMNKCGGYMEGTRIGGNMEMTRIGGNIEMMGVATNNEMDVTNNDEIEETCNVAETGMEITRNVVHTRLNSTALTSDTDMEVTNCAVANSTMADSVFENEMMSEFQAAVKVSSQPRIEDLPGSEPTSSNTSMEAPDYGGATATVKFSALTMANHTLVLPRKESEEDDMTRCPVQYFSYDPSQPISNLDTDNAVQLHNNVTVTVETNKQSETNETPKSQHVDESAVAEHCLPSSDVSLGSVQSSEVMIPSLAVSSEAMIPSSAEQSKATDESGWETMHSMIGLPPVTEVSMTPDVAPNKLVVSRRSRSSSTAPITEEPTPEKTTCLGGLMLQRSQQMSDVDLTTFLPPEESTRAINFALPSVRKLAAPAQDDSPEVLFRKIGSDPVLDIGDVTTFSPAEESTRAISSLMRLPSVRSAAAARHSVIEEQKSQDDDDIVTHNDDKPDVTVTNDLEHDDVVNKNDEVSDGIDDDDKETHDIVESERGATLTASDMVEGGREAALTSTDMVDVTRPGSQLGQYHMMETMSPGVDVTAAPGPCSCHVMAGVRSHNVSCHASVHNNDDDTLTAADDNKDVSLLHHNPLGNLKSTLLHSLTGREESPPKKIRLSTDSGLETLSSLSSASKTVVPSPSADKPIENITSSTTTATDVDKDVELEDNRMECCDDVATNEAEMNSIEKNYNPILENEPKESLEKLPTPVPEPAPKPITPVEVSIFDDLEAKRRTTCSPRDWKLTRVHEKYVGYVYLDLFLLVIIDLGDKLEPKKSRKSVGRVVHHWTVKDIKLISLHREDNEGHEDDELLDSGEHSEKSIKYKHFAIIYFKVKGGLKTASIVILDRCFFFLLV